MSENYAQESYAMTDWLGDPRHAEPCGAFPADAERVSHTGLVAWHGDAFAENLVELSVGDGEGVLFVEQVGAVSARTARASGATLQSRILRVQLHGSTQASTFRRSLAALLWKELDLRCTRPRTLDAESNARLTAWMLEHLRVATFPVDDRRRLKQLESDAVRRLDPVLNLADVANTPGRRQLRALRRKHLSVSGADVERIERLLKLHAAASAGGEGSDFLRRRLEHEQRRLAAQSG